MKPINYWTDTKKPRNLATLTPHECSQLLETLKNTEAKEWIARHKRKQYDLGTMNASGWWRQTLSDIQQKRGQAAVDDLRRRMNNLKGNQ
jgi:hypothetical protein